MVPATLTRSLLMGTMNLFLPVGTGLPSLVAAAAGSAAVSVAAPDFGWLRACSSLGNRMNRVVTKARTGMLTTATINGSQGLSPPEAPGAAPADSAASADSPASAPAASSCGARGVFSVNVVGIGLNDYRFMFTSVESISSLVVMILELASKARWAVMRLAISLARSTLELSRAPD